MEKRKKNSKVLYLLIFMVVAIFTISFFSVKSIVAEGEFEEPVKSENINSTISKTVNDGGELISLEKSGMDENLYRALIEIYNEKMGYEPNSINYVTSLSTHLFSGLEITTLDLSHQNITSLTSFSWLYFNESLVELKLDFNNIISITTISGENPLFRVSPNLKTLSISNNNLESVTLLSMPNLQTLNLNNNELSEVDLSMLSPTEENELNVNLSCNDISEWSDIKFPSDNSLQNKLNINVMANCLKKPDFTSSNINLLLGFQNNSYHSNSFTTSQSAYYYKTGVENLRLVLGIKDSDIAPVVLSDLNASEGVNLSELLGVGTFSAYYSINPTTLENVYNKDSVEYSMFEPFEFTIAPTKPTCKLKVGDEEKDFDNSSTIGAKDIIKFYTVDEGAEIYYRISNEEEWIKGDTLKLTKGGQYSVSFKSVMKSKDGKSVESEMESILIKTSQSLLVPDIVLILFVALFALVFFAVIIPLIKKYIMKS